MSMDYADRRTQMPQQPPQTQPPAPPQHLPTPEPQPEQPQPQSPTATPTPTPASTPPLPPTRFDLLHATLVDTDARLRLSLSTLQCMQQLKRDVSQTERQRLEGLAAMHWPSVDIGYVSSDGNSMVGRILELLKALGPFLALQSWDATLGRYTYTKPDSEGPRRQLAKVQPTLFEQLQRYQPSRSFAISNAHTETAHVPKNADELLLLFAIELSSADLSILSPFLTQLIQALHTRGFDLNQRDSKGRTLLTRYASQCTKPEGVALVQQLLQLGACASVASANGRTLLTVWVKLNRPDLLLAALLERAPWHEFGMRAQLEAWQRAGGGQCLLEAAEAKGEAWQSVASLAREVDCHWRQAERPLLIISLCQFTPLISDLAHIVLSYRDGQERGHP